MHPSPSNAGLSEAEAEQLLKEAEAGQLASSAQDDWSALDESFWRSHDQSNSSSFKDVFKLLWSSLKASAQHVESLTLETLAFGWMPLVRSHEAEAPQVEGQPVPDASALLQAWLRYTRWAMAAYDDLKDTPSGLATKLGIQLPDVVYMQGDPAAGAKAAAAAAAAAGTPQAPAPSAVPSAGPGGAGSTGAAGAGAPGSAAAPAGPLPHLPAYFVALEHAAKQIVLVVRGTSALRDLVTDLCGHPTPVLDGHAHFGMLSAAKALIRTEITRLAELLKAYPGYNLMVVGHSLGGGVAALVAMLLRRVPELRTRLGGGPGLQITALTYATPPVVSRNLAEESVPYVTTIINNNDMIARTSVASISVLSRELEQSRAQAMANSQVVSFLQNSGALTASKTLVQTALKHYALSRAPAGALVGALVSSPAVRSTMATGFNLLSQTLSRSLANTAAADAGAANGTAAPGAPAAVAASPATTAPAVDSKEELKKKAEAVAGKFAAGFRAFSTKLKEEAAAAAATSAATVPAAPDAASAAAPAAGAAAPAAAAAAAPAPAAASKLGGLLGGFKMPSTAAELRVLGGTLLNKLDESMAKSGAPQQGADPAQPGGTTTAVAATAVAASVVEAGPAGTGGATAGTAVAVAAAAVTAAPAAAQENAPRAVLPASSSNSWLLGAGSNSQEAQVVQQQGAAGAEGDAVPAQPLQYLFNPGSLFLIERDGGLDAAGLAVHRLKKVASLEAFNRLLLRRSMLKDHYLAAYVAALQALLQHQGHQPAPSAAAVAAH